MCVMWSESAIRGCDVDVTVKGGWGEEEKKQMSSADGYPAVASSWDSQCSQMLRGEQQPCVVAKKHTRGDNDDK